MKLIILGAGGYGREIADIASHINNYDDIYYLDDSSTAPYVIGKCEEFINSINGDTHFFVAFGNNEARSKWISKLKNHSANLATIIHPTAYVSPTATIGEAVAILPQAIVNSYSIIRDGCLINSGAIVDHDCIIDECSHICLGAIIKADNYIPAGMKVEAGSVIERDTYKGDR